MALVSSVISIGGQPAGAFEFDIPDARLEAFIERVREVALDEARIGATESILSANQQVIDEAVEAAIPRAPA